MITNDLIGAATIAVFGAVDVYIVYLAACKSFPTAIFLAALAIVTLRMFARQALQEIAQ